MKTQFAFFDADRSKMLTDLYEVSAAVPIPAIGDKVRVLDSGWYEVRDRKIVYEKDSILVY